MAIVCPQEKKKILMSLIDDMTAAALDRSSQGYSQFLHCRSELIAIIDSYMREDQMRIEFASDMQKRLNKFFEIDCTNNRT